MNVINRRLSAYTMVEIIKIQKKENKRRDKYKRNKTHETHKIWIKQISRDL